MPTRLSCQIDRYIAALYFPYSILPPILGTLPGLVAFIIRHLYKRYDLLEAVSKLSREDNKASELNKAQEIEGVVFISSD